MSTKGIPSKRGAFVVDQATLILNDRYELERELGRGGMSVVYLARDRQLLLKRVVVKILLEESNLDPWIRQKFLQEMEALSRIDHPGVVGVLDTGLTAEKKQFLVMQYIEGETLRAAIQPGGINAARAAGLIRQIGFALAAAHEKGVWHRDLKPENIMVQSLSGEDHVKLIDFGIAGIQNSQFTGEQTKVAGSFAYMAPEQLDGRPCAASDTYALGVVAYEMLTGVRPGASGELGQELPGAVAAPIRKAMSFHPDLRHTTVREFSEELYHALAGGESTRRSAVPGAIEMAHVLFTDLVGYSLLPMDQQKEYLGELQQIVRESAQFRAAELAGSIISLPTGDGMALAFFGDPTAPAQCALEMAAGLKSRPHLKLRMGIHSGPVYRVADVNANANVAGGGINMAQRVMDCGDAGHILMSKSTADVLLQLSQWSPYLTDLGECVVKHGVKVHLCRLATAELGNPTRPRKLGAASFRVRSRAGLVTALTLILIGTASAVWFGRTARNSPSRDERSIAVLPFEDMSPEKNQEYFSDGLSEELLNELAGIRGLRVTGRTSSFQFKGKAGDARLVGRKLNVATILEGSVRRQGNRARIAVKLTQTADGFQLWSQIFDRDASDIFAVQEEIARAVAGALQIELLGGKAVGPATKSTNTEAHIAYLQGRYFLLGRRTKQNLEKAAGYFQQAIGLEAGYAPAWMGLGESRNGQADLGYLPEKEGYGQAREAIERALSLNPGLAEAHAVLGSIKMVHEWDWAGADVSFQKAMALEPRNAMVIGGAGSLAWILGRLDQAIALYHQAIQIDPLYSNLYYYLGNVLDYAGRPDEAKAAVTKALELTPEMETAHGLLSRIYLANSPEEALAEAGKEKHPVFHLWSLAMAYHALGRKRESDEILAELIAKFQADDPFQIAEVYGFRGQTDRALEWLGRAWSEHDSGLTEIKGDPLLKSLRGDPRYGDLLRKMRLPL